MARIETYAQDDNVEGSDRLIGTDSAGDVTKNYSLDSVLDFLVEETTGNIVVNEPDEEDITALNNKLKFKDRDASGNQQGYKIIREAFDWLNIPASYADSIWEIRYEFDLGNAAIVLPDNVCLFYNGGFIKNYFSITAVNGKSTVSESTGFDESGPITGITFGEFFTTEDKIKLDAERFDATIGSTGAEYTTFKAAVDAGETSIRATSNTTEILGAILGNSVVLYIDEGVICDFGAFNITASVNGIKFLKEGNGDVSYSSTTVDQEFFDRGSNLDCSFTYSGGQWINTSTQSGCALSNAQNQSIFNTILDLPNLASCGVNFKDEKCFFYNSTIIGGGSLCSRVIQFTDGIIEGIVILGTIDPVNPTIDKSGYPGSISNISLYTSGFPTIHIRSGVLDNIRSTLLRVKFFDNNCIVSNTNVDGAIVIDLNGFNFHQFVNIKNATILSAALIIECYFSNVEISSDLSIDMFRCNINNMTVRTNKNMTIGGDGNSISNVTLESGDITINGNTMSLSNIKSLSGDLNIFGDDNNVSNCNAANIAIDATANNTKLSNCGAGAGVVTDNGTNTLIINTPLT